MFDYDSDLDDQNRTHGNVDAILTHDHLYDFLNHSVPTEGMLDRPEEVHVDKICNFMPTTDVGSTDFEVEEETLYGFKFSGCNILNNPVSLLTRKKYELKCNNYLNHNV